MSARRRRTKGEGSVYEDRTRGRWVAEVYLGSGADGRRVRRKAYAKTEAEAKTALRRLLAEAEQGRPGEKGETVAEYLERWVAEVLPARRVGQGTIDDYAWAVRKHLVPLLGKRRRVAQGLGRNSVRIVRTVLGVALAHAEQRGLVEKNVARLAIIPATAKAKVRPRRSLDPDEVPAFVRAVGGHRLEAMWLCGLALGPRPGELAGLAWAGVDLERGVLSITESRIYEHGEMRLGAPKTQKSARTLKMPGPLTESFRRRRAAWEAEREGAGGRWVENDLVFCTRNGTPLDPANLRATLSRLLERAGLGRLVPYELRHSATSLLSDAKVPIEELADMLGHTTTRMVEDVYRHRVRKVIDVGRSPLEGLPVGDKEGRGTGRVRGSSAVGSDR